jgi:hypothetical protein
VAKEDLALTRVLALGIRGKDVIAVKRMLSRGPAPDYRGRLSRPATATTPASRAQSPKAPDFWKTLNAWLAKGM